MKIAACFEEINQQLASAKIDPYLKQFSKVFWFLGWIVQLMQDWY